MAEGICIIGVFEVDGDKIKKIRLFSKDPEEIFKELDKTDEYDKEASDYLNKNIRDVAKQAGYSDKELNVIFSKIAILQAKKEISKIDRRDRLIIHTISALSDMDKILNTMTERLREWYGLHYPELKIKSHSHFSKMVAEHGKRENFPDFTKSMGMELREDDIKIIKTYANELKDLYELRKKLEIYLNKIVPEEMPNTCALTGPILTARLLSGAGSLEKLAKMPSSTLQLIGAEKALFKFLKGKQKKVPKFGVLFTHPDVSTAKKDLQGKIARALSAKLVLAARADFYSKEDISEKLVSSYKKRLKAIK